jgi:hypothetical protein
MSHGQEVSDPSFMRAGASRARAPVPLRQDRAIAAYMIHNSKGTVKDLVLHGGNGKPHYVPFSSPGSVCRALLQGLVK